MRGDPPRRKFGHMGDTRLKKERSRTGEGRSGCRLQAPRPTVKRSASVSWALVELTSAPSRYRLFGTREFSDAPFTALTTRAVARSSAELISLSHTRTTRHPSVLSLRRTRLSRATFDRSFRIQYSLLWPVESFAIRCSSCRPCQKSPSAKTATRSRSKTRSGHPGKDDTFVVNCRPRSLKAWHSLASHFVPRFLLALAARRLELGVAGRRPAKDAKFSTGLRPRITQLLAI